MENLNKGGSPKSWKRRNTSKCLLRDKHSSNTKTQLRQKNLKKINLSSYDKTYSLNVLGDLFIW